MQLTHGLVPLGTVDVQFPTWRAPRMRIEHGAKANHTSCELKIAIYLIFSTLFYFIDIKMNVHKKQQLDAVDP